MPKRWSDPDEGKALIEHLQSKLNDWMATALEEVEDLRRKLIGKPEKDPEIRKVMEGHLERAAQKRRAVSDATAKLLSDFKAFPVPAAEGGPGVTEVPRFSSEAAHHLDELFRELQKPVNMRASLAVKAEGRQRVEIEDMNRAFREEVTARASGGAWGR